MIFTLHLCPHKLLKNFMLIFKTVCSEEDYIPDKPRKTPAVKQPGTEKAAATAEVHSVRRRRWLAR